MSVYLILSWLRSNKSFQSVEHCVQWLSITMKGLWVEMCENSSLHGIHYLVSEKRTLLEKMFWSVLLAIIMGYLTMLVQAEWENISNSSVVAEVENPHYDLGLIDFPAVTVCPYNNIVQSKVKTVLERFGKSAENSSGIENFIIAMSLMKFPYYNLPQDFVDYVNGNVYPIASEKIGHTMVDVMPEIDQMVMNCTWKTANYRCKNLFRNQITLPLGYCISFNSKTAIRNKNDSPDLPPVELPNKTLVSEKSNMFGRVSGLSFKLKSLVNKNLDKLVADCYTLFIHNPAEFPSITQALTIVPDNPFNKHKISVTVSIIESDESLKNLKESIRNCYLETSIKSVACEANCWVSLISDKCHCLPHFFSDIRPGYATCSVEHLECLRNITPQLQNYVVPDGVPGFPEWAGTSANNSCGCLQPCSSITYTPSVEINPLPLNEVDKGWTQVNIFYKTFAVKYSRKAESDFRNFLVNSGSLGGLLIGFSFVAAFDFIIYSLKFLIKGFYILFCGKKEVHKSLSITRSNKKRKQKKVFVDNKKSVLAKKNTIDALKRF